MPASLPWYDAPPLIPAWERLWGGLAGHLRHHGVAAPDALSWPDDPPEHWRHPELVLSQACGLDVATRMRGVLEPVAALHFAVPGAGEGTYRSAVVVRRDHPASSIDDVPGSRVAINDRWSWSGAGCLRAAFGDLDEAFSEVVHTGSHQESLVALREDRADVAAIDVVSWAFLGAWRRGVRVVGLTAPAAAPPLVIRAGQPVAPVLRALSDAWSDTGLADARSALRLVGWRPVTSRDYAPMAPFGPRPTPPPSPTPEPSWTCSTTPR